MAHSTFDEIKRIIFARKVGECRTVAEWQRLYSEGGKDLLIDHLTSCASCLNIVNTLLGLPALEDRNPFDALSRDSNDDNPFNASGGGQSSHSDDGGEEIDDSAILQQLRKADSDFSANRPEEITLCINGWPLASRRVQTGANELIVRPQLDEPLESLELLDENGRLLLHLPIGDECAAGVDRKWLDVSLSPHQSVNFAVVWIDDYPEIRLDYCDQKATSAPLIDREGAFSKFAARLRGWFSSLSIRELAAAAAGLLILLLIPVGLLLMESYRRESSAAMQREIDALKQERDALDRRLADEQARRQAAESERDNLKNRADGPIRDEKPQDEPVEIAAALGLRLRQGSDYDEALLFEDQRGQSVSPIVLKRSPKARFAVRLPRYNQDDQTPFEAYLFRLLIPGRPPIVGRLKPKATSVDTAFIVVDAEFLNTDKLAADTSAEATILGVVKNRQASLVKALLRFE